MARTDAHAVEGQQAAIDRASPWFVFWRITLPRFDSLNYIGVYQGTNGTKAGLVPLSRETMYMFLVTNEPDNPWFDEDKKVAALQERMDGQPLRIGQARADEGDVETVVAQAAHHVGRAAFLQHEGNVRPLEPELADRTSPGEWQESGSRTIYERAHDRVGEILGTHYPQYLDPAVDARIRERFPIRLDPADMRPGNGRW